MGYGAWGLGSGGSVGGWGPWDWSGAERHTLHEREAECRWLNPPPRKQPHVLARLNILDVGGDRGVSADAVTFHLADEITLRQRRRRLRRARLNTQARDGEALPLAHARQRLRLRRAVRQRGVPGYTWGCSLPTWGYGLGTWG